MMFQPWMTCNKLISCIVMLPYNYHKLVAIYWCNDVHYKKQSTNKSVNKSVFLMNKIVIEMNHTSPHLAVNGHILMHTMPRHVRPFSGVDFPEWNRHQRFKGLSIASASESNNQFFLALTSSTGRCDTTPYRHQLAFSQWNKIIYSFVRLFSQMFFFHIPWEGNI